MIYQVLLVETLVTFSPIWTFDFTNNNVVYNIIHILLINSGITLNIKVQKLFFNHAWPLLKEKSNAIFFFWQCDKRHCVTGSWTGSHGLELYNNCTIVCILRVPFGIQPVSTPCNYFSKLSIITFVANVSNLKITSDGRMFLCWELLNCEYGK